MTTRVNHPLRIYTAGIGLVCAGSVVFALEARQDAEHARSTADARVSIERSHTQQALELAASATAYSKKIHAQDLALVTRYNALVVLKKRDDRTYASELRKAQAAANAGVQTSYVGGGATYSYASSKSGGGGGGGTVASASAAPSTSSSAPASAPVTKTS
jgi:uncharacterized membrane protein